MAKDLQICNSKQFQGTMNCHGCTQNRATNSRFKKMICPCLQRHGVLCFETPARQSQLPALQAVYSQFRMLVFLTRLGLQLCGLPNCRCVRLVAGLPDVGFKSGLDLDDTIFVNSKAFLLIGLNDFLLVIFYPSYSSKFDFYLSTSNVSTSLSRRKRCLVDCCVKLDPASTPVSLPCRVLCTQRYQVGRRLQSQNLAI